MVDFCCVEERGGEERKEKEKKEAKHSEGVWVWDF
jgi:hypothetical protein